MLEGGTAMRALQPRLGTSHILQIPAGTGAAKIPRRNDGGPWHEILRRPFNRHN